LWKWGTIRSAMDEPLVERVQKGRPDHSDELVRCL